MKIRKIQIIKSIYKSIKTVDDYLFFKKNYISIPCNILKYIQITIKKVKKCFLINIAIFYENIH